MRKLLSSFFVAFALLFSGGAAVLVLPAQSALAQAHSPGNACTPSGGGFLGFPTWYKYVDGQWSTNPDTGQDACLPVVNSINSLWSIVAAVIEILLRLAAIVAMGFIVYGGVMYTISQGQPDKTKLALQTVINALVGLVIAIVATAVVSFIAGRFA